MADLRTIENASIRTFVQSAADEGYLSGRVLDYGAGDMPYRSIVESAGGIYQPWDRANNPANVGGHDVGREEWYEDEYDAILCTQVVQYIPFGDTWSLDDDMAEWKNVLIGAHGHLVLTYPTNWPEVEPEDLHRFTKAGMERLLTEAGFEIVRHERRATIADWFATPWARRDEIDQFALGYGVVARA